VTITYCPECLKKQREINRLKEELAGVKAKLRYQERTAKEGFFGSSTPSAKVPVKSNTLAERQERRGGAPKGHPGHGRQAIGWAQADRVEPVALRGLCPNCGGRLESVEYRERGVLEAAPVRLQRVLYRLERKRCIRCRRVGEARAPGVLPKGLYSNSFLTHVAVQHYVHGVPLGSLERQLGIGHGSLVQALHRLAERFQTVSDQMIAEYRQAPVRHADETGWRTDGQNGYTWLFCTPHLSLFRFRKTRAASVAQDLLGSAPLPGHLIVDRYGVYNKSPCALQYCYAHLLRLVQDLKKDFPNDREVHRFVAALAPLLVQAMGLRRRPLPRRAFRRRADAIRRRMERLVHRPAHHPGVQSVQDVFRQNHDRLYHWTEDPSIPAENNLAERELRPLVIARKISFGSQSDAGARTREILMSVLLTLKKRTPHLTAAFQYALDHLASDPCLDPHRLLFPPHSS